MHPNFSVDADISHLHLSDQFLRPNRYQIIIQILITTIKRKKLMFSCKALKRHFSHHMYLHLLVFHLFYFSQKVIYFCIYTCTFSFPLFGSRKILYFRKELLGILAIKYGSVSNWFGHTCKNITPRAFEHRREAWRGLTWQKSELYLSLPNISL